MGRAEGLRHFKVEILKFRWMISPMIARLQYLKLKELLVVYPGTREYALAENIRAVPLATACAPTQGA
jgi:hypothetical protein